VIRPEVLEQAEKFAEQFRSAQPYRHLAIEGFLDALACQRILDGFPRFEDRYALNEMGEVGGKAVRMNVRDVSDAYRDLDRYLQTREFLDFISQVTGIPDLLYDADYIGGGTHENRNGQSLDAHIDFNYHPSERWHRRLNLLLYLNPRWSREWGGCLQLYADPRVDATPSVTVVPAFNRCVIFETSERSWHGFDEIRLPVDDHPVPPSRRSIALYFYTSERPQAETADRHSTVYQHRPLPPRFIAGHTLTGQDVEALRALLAQRDAYIDMQHAENRRLLQAQEHGLVGQILYLMKRAYVRFRR